MLRPDVGRSCASRVNSVNGLRGNPDRAHAHLVISADASFGSYVVGNSLAFLDVREGWVNATAAFAGAPLRTFFRAELFTTIFS